MLVLSLLFLEVTTLFLIATGAHKILFLLCVFAGLLCIQVEALCC